MARVSSVMRTWPHPLTRSPAVKSREALLLAECRDQRSSACDCEPSVLFMYSVMLLFFIFLFLGRLLILVTLHTSVPSPPLLLPSCHWRKIALVFRGLSSLVGLERTRNVWRRFSGWRLSASAYFWSETCSRWLRSWTLYGCLRCVNWFKTGLTPHEKRRSTNWTEWQTTENRMVCGYLGQFFLLFPGDLQRPHDILLSPLNAEKPSLLLTSSWAYTLICSCHNIPVFGHSYGSLFARSLTEMTVSIAEDHVSLSLCSGLFKVFYWIGARNINFLWQVVNLN